MIEIDCRGYSCPIPVVKTKKGIEENPGKDIKVILNSQTAVENVKRLGGNSGYDVSVSRDGDDYVLTLKPLK